MVREGDSTTGSVQGREDPFPISTRTPFVPFGLRVVGSPLDVTRSKEGDRKSQGGPVREG